MSIKPILFNTDMVRAILDGRKTQTRRVVKPQPRGRICYIMAGSNHGKWNYPGENAAEYWGEEFRLPDNLTEEERLKHWTPPCHTDDILWMRETWRKNVCPQSANYGGYDYRVDYDGHPIQKMINWSPSIHMPKEAARIFLRVTNVRVERLLSISHEDVLAEGVPECPGRINYGDDCVFADIKFYQLWNSTIRPADRDKYSWQANPWVWVISFERCEKPEEWPT